MTRRPNFVIFSEQASSRDKKKGGTFFECVPPFSVFMSGIFCGIEWFYFENTVLRGAGNAGNRDSINVKVFEEEGVGSGEGEEKLSGESFSSPSPNPTLSSSKTFDFIESLFAAFPVYPVGNFEKSVLFGTGSF